MALQDKIFDVAEALEGKPEAQDFQDIIDHMNEVEAAQELAEQYLQAIRTGLRALRALEEVD